MPTRIQTLPPPFRNNDTKNSDDSDDDTVSSWDSTYQQQQQQQPVEPNNVAQHPQICSHAVSIGHDVFGIKSSISDEDMESNENFNDGIDHPWWTWQRSLADVNQPTGSSGGIGIINALRSNSSGTVIAVASDTGVVSLLRGCDGHVLATRRIGTQTSNIYSIRLTWISGSHEQQQQRDENYTDTLLIEVPSTDEDSTGSSNSQLILVANINGRKLNDCDPNVVTDAVRQTQIIPVPMNTTTKYDLRAFAASRTWSNETMIRLVACDGDSHLVLLDFDRVTQDLTLIQDGISLQLQDTAIGSNLDYTIDFELGFYQQIIPKETLIICSAFVDPMFPMIAWFSPLVGQTVCVYSVPVPERKTPHPPSTITNKIIAMEAIASWDTCESMATAVAVKSIQKSGIATTSSILTRIYVIQTSLDDSFGLTSYGTPHVVYVIPIEESVISIQMASFRYDENSFPYSFRYQVWTDSATNTNCRYKSFQTDRTVGMNVGKLRTNIHRNNFQEADRIVEKMGLMSLTMEPYANFHPSEIVLHRLQHTVRQTTITADNDENATGILIDEIKLCLRELVHGVILKSGHTGNTLGFDLFVQCIEFLTDDVSMTNLKLPTFHQCIIQIALSIESLIPNIENNIHTEKLELLHHAILEQKMVLDFLTSGSSQQNVLVPYHSIKSLPKLYEFFIQKHHFILAEITFRSNRKALCWSPATLVIPLLQFVTDANVAPKEYMFLLQDVIFANLTVNDRMLSRLKAWSCRIADALDDSNVCDRDLNGAILLLKVMDAGIRKLQLRIHGSFASYSPFTCKNMDTRHPANRRSSPKTNSSEEIHGSDVCKRSFSFGTQLHSRTKKSVDNPWSLRDEPIPTILERGALQRGPTNSSTTAVKSYDVGDDESVQVKLLHAQCIKDARDLGLGRDVVSLRDFVSYGGSKRIAKDLVQLLSSSVDTHERRIQLLNEHCLPFCRRYFIEYDQALQDCVVDICHNKNVAIQSVEECCSITRCCTSSIVRCQVTLTILQAVLNCGCTCESLYLLSKEAINVWSSKDTSVQSELQEALRLLKIDDIVLRYCGTNARDLFRVSNPIHASNLLQFVTQQIECETLVDDVIALCDAFNNLSVYDATRMIIENSILHNDSQRCLVIVDKLLMENVDFAEHAIVSGINLGEAILNECSYAIHTDLRNSRREIYKERAICVSTKILALLRFAMKRSQKFISLKVPVLLPACTSEDISLNSLQAIFLRIQKLQKEYSIFVAVADMYQPNAILHRVLPFMENIAIRCTRNDVSLVKNALSIASTICSQLTMLSKPEERDIWVTASTLVAAKMVRNGNCNRVLDFFNCHWRDFKYE